jgi:hypothetical protein
MDFGALNTYPHIARRLDSMWGSQEARDFMMDLLTDSRDGGRQGFDPSVASAILSLLDKHDHSYPQFSRKSDVRSDYRFAPKPTVYEKPKTDLSKVMGILVDFAVLLLVLGLVKKLFF